MCGIYGIVNHQRTSPDEGIAPAMGRSTRHRGPDHNGEHLEPGVVLGINRLAIVDVDRGNQPIYNEDGSLVIVYNGELYNHDELRRDLLRRGHHFRTHTDTETVLHAFEEFGERCLDRFNGMFALAIWDRKRRRLFIARDRLGIKPLYVAPVREGLAFASEVKALLAVVPDGPQPDWTVIHRYLSFGYVPAGDCPFAGIRKFEAGHYGFVEAGRLRTQRYWAPSYGLGETMSFGEARERLDHVLAEAVHRELMSDVPVGVFLSGGLDSSAVAVYARRQYGPRLRSFALRFEETTHDESADARMVAEHLGLDHREVRFTERDLRRSLYDVADAIDEPFGDSTVLPLLALSRRAAEEMRVVLTGWGGDELFAGYPTYRAHGLARFYRRMPRLVSRYMLPAVVGRLPVSDRYMSFEFKARRFLRGMDLPPELQHFLWMGYFDDADKSRLLAPEVLEQVQSPTLQPVIDRLAELPERETVDRIMHLDALFFLEGNGLFQADRMTMAASLEARVPLLNRDVFDFVSALPLDIRMHRGQLKELLRSVMRPHLPPTILDKPKKGFGPPSAAWVRGPLAATIDRVLAREKIEQQGMLCYDEVRHLIDEHRARRADHGRNLWAVLSLQMWYDRWIAEAACGRRDATPGHCCEEPMTAAALTGGAA